MKNLPKRKSRVSPDEIEKMIEWSRRGVTNKDIASRLGRDENTIGKHILQHRNEAIFEEIRRDALASALRGHWQMLSSNAISFSERFTVLATGKAKFFAKSDLPSIQTLDLRERHIIECLREHMPYNEIWMFLNDWDGAIRKWKQMCGEIQRQSREELESSHLYEYIYESQFLDAILGVWLSLQNNEGIDDFTLGSQSRGRYSIFGEKGYRYSGLEKGSREKSEDLGMSFRDKYRRFDFTLMYGSPSFQSEVFAKGPDEKSMEAVRNLFEETIQKIGVQRGEFKNIFSELQVLAIRISEAAGRIGLFTGFEGECSLCPIQTRKRRKKFRSEREANG